MMMTGQKNLHSREVTYNLSDGKYKFNLLSVNEDGLTQENPLTFEINIKAAGLENMVVYPVTDRCCNRNCDPDRKGT